MTAITGQFTAHRGRPDHPQPPLAGRRTLRQRTPAKVEMVGLDIGREDDTHHAGRVSESLMSVCLRGRCKSVHTL